MSGPGLNLPSQSPPSPLILTTKKGRRATTVWWPRLPIFQPVYDWQYWKLLRNEWMYHLFPLPPNVIDKHNQCYLFTVSQTKMDLFPPGSSEAVAHFLNNFPQNRKVGDYTDIIWNLLSPVISFKFIFSRDQTSILIRRQMT